MSKSITSPDSSHPHKPTFRQIPDGVFALGKPSATHLYGIMLQIGKRNRTITASWNTLAGASGMDRKTVQTAIGVLVKSGYITTTHRYSEGRRSSDSIILHDVPVVENLHHMVEKTDQAMVQKTDHGGVKNGPLNGYVTDTSRDVLVDIPTHKENPTEETMGDKRMTRLPDDFTMPDEWRSAAKELGIEHDCEWQFDAFIDNHLAKGSKFVDWKRAWRTWCRNAVSWNNRGPRTVNAAPAQSEKVTAAIAERERLLLGQWQGQREALMYAPKSDGPQNVAQRIAELDRIINDQFAA